jgi:bacterial/archaeal transporter family protein
MTNWLLPTIGAMLCWGLWGFIPKQTTKYLTPTSAIFYEVLGGVVFAGLVLLFTRTPPTFHPQGAALAMSTGMLGFLGALCFLTAVTRGPVTLVSIVSALYPVVTIFLSIVVLHEGLTLRQGIGVILAGLALVLIVG